GLRRSPVPDAWSGDCDSRSSHWSRRVRNGCTGHAGIGRDRRRVEGNVAAITLLFVAAVVQVDARQVHGAFVDRFFSVLAPDVGLPFAVVFGLFGDAVRTAVVDGGEDAETLVLQAAAEVGLQQIIVRGFALVLGAVVEAVAGEQAR